MQPHPEPWRRLILAHLKYAAGRFDLVGALVRANRRWVPLLCGIGIAVTAGVWQFFARRQARVIPELGF